MAAVEDLRVLADEVLDQARARPTPAQQAEALDALSEHWLALGHIAAQEAADRRAEIAAGDEPGS